MKFWSVSLLPVHLVLILTMFMLPVFFTDFKPSYEMNINAAIFGGGLAILSFPVSIMLFATLPRHLGLIQLLLLSFCFLFIVFVCGWAAANGSFGYIANRYYGHETIKTLEIKSKHSCLHRRKCTCNTEIRLITNPLMSMVPFA